MLALNMLIFTLSAFIIFMFISKMVFDYKVRSMPEKDACIEFYSNSTDLPARCLKYFVK